MIGAITFGKTFGFMEQRKDIRDVIFGVDTGLHYGSIVGQVPLLHPYLLGNITVRRILERSVPAYRDPIAIVTQVCFGTVSKLRKTAIDTQNRWCKRASRRMMQKVRQKLTGRVLTP